MCATPILAYEVHIGAISITQWGFDNDCYVGKPCWPMGKIFLIAMGFVDHLGQSLQKLTVFLGFETNLDFSNQKSGCR